MTKLNYIKAQQDVLKEYLQGKRVIYNKIDGFIVYGTSYQLYITPADKVGILWGSTIKDDTIRAILNDEKDRWVYLTNECVQQDKDILKCFSDGQNLKIYVNNKLLKNFKLENCTFKGVDSSQGLHIYENGIQVGFVMPTRLKVN